MIGDEILSGRTQDRNIAQIATWLNLQGIRLAEVRVVPTIEARIVEAVNALRARHDYLFTTGGIGPTHDDITVDAIAAALGVPVSSIREARATLEAYYATRGGVTEARLRMARVPEGAELIENWTSGAPGIRVGNIFILAGIPHIAAMMLDALTGPLEGGRPLLSRTIGCWVPESEVADLLRETEAPIPAARSAPIPSSARAGAAPISSSAAPTKGAARPAWPISSSGWRRPAGRSRRRHLGCFDSGEASFKEGVLDQEQSRRCGRFERSGEVMDRCFTLVRGPDLGDRRPAVAFVMALAIVLSGRSSGPISASPTPGSWSSTPAPPSSPS